MRIKHPQLTTFASFVYDSLHIFKRICQRFHVARSTPLETGGTETAQLPHCRSAPFDLSVPSTPHGVKVAKGLLKLECQRLQRCTARTS